MSKIDRIKEELKWFRLIFALAAASATLLVWSIAVNYERAPTALLLIAFITAGLLTMCLVQSARAVFSRLKELEHGK